MDKLIFGMILSSLLISCLINSRRVNDGVATIDGFVLTEKFEVPITATLTFLYHNNEIEKVLSEETGYYEARIPSKFLGKECRVVIEPVCFFLKKDTIFEGYIGVQRTCRVSDTVLIKIKSMKIKSNMYHSNCNDFLLLENIIPDH